MIRLRLKDLLKERNQSLYWLAEKSGVSYKTIHRLSNGSEGIQFGTLSKLCDALECVPADLFEYHPEKRK